MILMFCTHTRVKCSILYHLHYHMYPQQNLSSAVLTRTFQMSQVEHLYFLTHICTCTYVGRVHLSFFNLTCVMDELGMDLTGQAD